MDKNKLKKINEVADETENANAQPDILDILLDEDNKDPIVLADESGKRLTFEQIAVIPYNEKVYCVLKPVDHIDGINDDEAIVFYVDERPTGPVLMVEPNEKTAINVFDEYYNLLDAEQAKNKAAKKKPAKK
ncbi:MAG: hypothetical protein IJ817_01690 [Clostridia bacterium]|nr:hypothetical protein [Clostridia bacterium]